MSVATEVASLIDRIVRNELDDVDRYIRNGDLDRARRDLDDAVTKLKRLSSNENPAASGGLGRGDLVRFCVLSISRRMSRA